MKRLYLVSTILLVMKAMMLPANLNAQVSVWDGTAAIWTHGSGTQNDPYLIESAQNLAWLCNGVGSGSSYVNKYFRLTTDINLASIPWTPIGDDVVNHVFRGKFDGNNHFIDNMVIGSFYCKGLFGVTGDGFCCNNLGVNISITSTGGLSGGIVGSAHGEFNIANCHVQGSLKGNYAGGIVGGISNSSGASISNCYNEASISAVGTSSSSSSVAYSYAGGIVGAMKCSFILINKCCNKGSVYASSTSSVSETVAHSGGIVGYIFYEYDGNYWYNQNKILNCYNTGSVSSYAKSYSAFSTPYPEAYSYSGGIVGWIRPYPYNNADYNTISNCYNTGSLSATYSSNNSSSEAMKGGIVAKIHLNHSSYVHMLNCYYLNTCGGTGSGISQTETQMKSSSFLTTLNTDSLVFVKDITPYINQGYPVFGSVRTLSANNIGMTTATLNGDYQMPYDVDVHGFEYKKTSENNFTTVITPDSSPASKSLTGLDIGTQYTFRFFVQKDGVYYRGANKTFNTIQCTLAAQISSSSNTLCEGDTITFTATATSSTPTIYQYVWSTGDSLNSISVSDDAIYTVTVTDAYGCTNTATKTVSVNPTYNIPLTHSMCQGESYNFFGQNITAAGTYTHTLQTVNGCDSVLTLVVTLKALPPIAITGNTSICEGQATTLTANGGVSYVWSNGSTSNSINVAQSGVYTVQATNVEGCAATATATVTVNPLPVIVINGNTTICEGSSTTLTASGADTYSWSTGDNTASAIISSFGIYNVTGTSAAGCSSVASVTVLVSQLPIITITGETDICAGESTTLTANGGTTYLWSNGTTDATLTVSTPGTWQVIGYNEAGCNSMASATVSVWQPAISEFSIECPDSCYTWNSQSYCTSGDYTQTLQTVHGCDSVVTLHLTITVGVDDYDGFDFKVYPNPTTRVVNVECTMNNVQFGDVELHLVDAYGRFLNAVRANNHSPLQTAQIDLSRYANGVYFVKAVADGKTIAVRKVVKQ